MQLLMVFCNHDKVHHVCSVFFIFLCIFVYTRTLEHDMTAQATNHVCVYVYTQLSTYHPSFVWLSFFFMDYSVTFFDTISHLVCVLLWWHHLIIIWYTCDFSRQAIFYRNMSKNHLKLTIADVLKDDVHTDAYIYRCTSVQKPVKRGLDWHQIQIKLKAGLKKRWDENMSN